MRVLGAAILDQSSYPLLKQQLNFLSMSDRLSAVDSNIVYFISKHRFLFFLNLLTKRSSSFRKVSGILKKFDIIIQNL